jgi:hypothetical protein
MLQPLGIAPLPCSGVLTPRATSAHGSCLAVHWRRNAAREPRSRRQSTPRRAQPTIGDDMHGAPGLRLPVARRSPVVTPRRSPAGRAAQVRARLVLKRPTHSWRGGRWPCRDHARATRCCTGGSAVFDVFSGSCMQPAGRRAGCRREPFSQSPARRRRHGPAFCRMSYRRIVLEC